MNLFLIDADNLNCGAWIDEAFAVLEAAEGTFAVRRAYGSAENLKALADTLRAWAVRPFVNLALTKNTTDMALAVDAMELACQGPVPNLIVIGSGDADFTPLVVRLRERGIRVVCVSERGKMGREAIPAYDQVVLVGPEMSPPDGAPLASLAQPARKATRKTAAKKAPASPEPTDNGPKARASAAKPAARKTTPKTAARKKANAVPQAPDPAAASQLVLEMPMPESESDSDSGELPGHPAPNSVLDVSAILAAVPAFRSGQAQPLAAVAKALIDAKLRGKNTTATKLLRKFPAHFVLAPSDKPRTVQYTPVPQAT
ncbi:MAG: hypothetical protein BWK72_10500 [Rhodoferax ferrireducens]|uniref:NYN domain-containing protein n=2 Tax=Pseudomonadota TaxID=1224 RepID=A0A1Y1QZF4_9GAMM|nr:MAG: hypothetical protein BWK72_10500 [Rhodoferax ferrireducens]OQX16893.1 MAG: hypothetical protein BWK73_02885 [Thiothrix lacustris]